MAIHQNPDRNSDYMHQMWGTTHLITDYLPNSPKKIEEKRVIQEIMHDEMHHTQKNLVEQSKLHQKIRNDEDYDDWEYGTEPVFDSPWNKL